MTDLEKQRKKKNCTLNSALAGMLLGLGLGVGFGWPLGPLPAVLMGFSGFAVGFIGGGAIGSVLCRILIDIFDREGPWDFAKPYFDSVTVTAVSPPAHKNTPCSLETHWQMNGNTDRVNVVVTYTIVATAGTPYPLVNPGAGNTNASTQGRSHRDNITWAEEHDGRDVQVIVQGIATKDGQVYTFSRSAGTRVEVHP